jgi:hypothetical protein
MLEQGKPNTNSSSGRVSGALHGVAMILREGLIRQQKPKNVTLKGQ